jgi:hypothetical protein
MPVNSTPHGLLVRLVGIVPGLSLTQSRIFCESLPLRYGPASSSSSQQVRPRLGANHDSLARPSTGGFGWRLADSRPCPETSSCHWNRCDQDSEPIVSPAQRLAALRGSPIASTACKSWGTCQVTVLRPGLGVSVTDNSQRQDSKAPANTHPWRRPGHSTDQ